MTGAAHVHVVPGAGVPMPGIGIAAVVVGAFVFIRAAPIRKRVGLAPGQTEPPGPLQPGSAVYQVVFCIAGPGLLIGGIVIVS